MDFADTIEILDLKTGAVPWIIQVGPMTWALKSRELPQAGVKERKKELWKYQEKTWHPIGIWRWRGEGEVRTQEALSIAQDWQSAREKKAQLSNVRT